MCICTQIYIYVGLFRSLLMLDLLFFIFNDLLLFLCLISFVSFLKLSFLYARFFFAYMDLTVH